MTSAAPYAGKQKIKLTDFMPQWDPNAPSPDAMDPEEIMESIRALANKRYAEEEEEDIFYGSPSDVHPESAS